MDKEVGVMYRLLIKQKANIIIIGSKYLLRQEVGIRKWLWMNCKVAITRTGSGLYIAQKVDT